MKGAKTYIPQYMQQCIPRRAQLPWLAWIILASELFACGLPTYTLFYLPSLTVDASTVTIRHNSQNDNVQNTQIYGYDLYYKLYKKGSTLVSDDINYIGSDTRVPTPSVLTTRNFLKTKMVDYEENQDRFVPNSTYSGSPNLLMGSSVQTALIDFSTKTRRGVESQATVTFNRADQTTNTVILHRNLDSGSTRLSASFFSENYTANDADIKKMIPGFNSTDEIEVIFAAIPVGINTLNLQELYGTIAVANNGIQIN